MAIATVAPDFERVAVGLAVHRQHNRFVGSSWEPGIARPVAGKTTAVVAVVVDVAAAAAAARGLQKGYSALGQA